MDEIYHDPYVLLSAISALHGGEWTIDQVGGTIQILFDKQYILTETVTTETRYRIETRTGTTTYTDPDTGETITETYEYEVQVPYTYYICNVTLENFNLSHVPVYIMSQEQLSMYATYMSSLGNRPDLFPDSEYVETVCLLSKLNAKQHIEINLDMDELDLTDAEKKATYQEIKDYVLEHSGLKVSSLYIAQVKQKCGIIERENYNKPKSEDAKQPQCPPDKEKAIKEALKHFGMI